MCLDDRFALRDGVQDFRDTMGDVVTNDIFDKQGRQRDTDNRRDEVPPGPFIRDQLLLYKPLYQVDKRFQQGRCGCGKRSYEEREKQYQMLLAEMAFPPLDYSIVPQVRHSSQPMPLYLSRSHSSSTSLR